MVFFCILLILQGILFSIWTQSSAIDAKEYQELQLQIQDKSLEEAKAFLETELETSKANKGEESFLETNQSETDVKKTYDKETLQRVLDENLHLLEYPIYIQRLLNLGSDQANISIFEDKQQFSKELRDSIRSNYMGKDLVAGDQSLGSYAVEQILRYPFMDVIVLLLMISILLILVDKEEEMGSLSYLRTMKKGSYQTYLSKFSSMTMVLVLFLVASYLIFYVISGTRYGFVNLSSPIQSIPYCGSVPSVMSILDFLLYSIGLRCLVLASMLQVLYALVFLSRKTLFGVLLLGLLMLLGYGLSSITADPNHWLHFFSPSHLLHPETSYMQVRYYAFFDHAISFVYFYFGMMVVGFGLFYLGYRAYQKGDIQAKSLRLHVIDRRFHSIFFYELKKTWITCFGIGMMVIFLLLTAGKLNTIKLVNYQEDEVIGYYIDHIGKSPTDQTYKLIKEEKARYLELHDRLQRTNEESEKQKINQVLENEKIFEEYCYRMDRLEKDTEREVLKEEQFRLFFENDQVYVLIIFGYLLMCILLCLMSYEKESLSGVELYLKTTNVGKKSLFHDKTMSITILLTTTWILCHGMILMFQHRLYPNSAWSSAINDLQHLGSFPFRMSILSYLLLQLAVQLLLTYLLTYCVLFLFSKTKHGKQVAIILSLCCMVPLLLSLTGSSGTTLFLAIFYPYKNIEVFMFEFIIILILFIVCFCMRKREATYA